MASLIARFCRFLLIVLFLHEIYQSFCELPNVMMVHPYTTPNANAVSNNKSTITTNGSTSSHRTEGSSHHITTKEAIYCIYSYYFNMTSAAFVAAEYVAPTIGAIMSTLTFSAPIKSLKSSIKSGSLGSLNPTPWAFMTGK